MHMAYGKTHTTGYVTRNQKAKLAADYQELLRELSANNINSVGNYVLEGTIGEGTFGKVKLATHILTGQKVAIKILPKTQAEHLTREIYHHRYLHHPNIISLLEIIPTENKIYLVLEYCEGGELYDFLVKRGRLRENLARKMFGQLCRAVKYCHDRRVVHRDLKLENILLDAHDNIKLADFGFTRECESKRLLETICGSPGYSAPEMLRGNKYSGLEVDIWSLGVILYTLLCGWLPFDDDDENEMRLKIIKGEYEMEEFLSNEAKDLIRSILQLEPSERPTLKQILQHEWFKIKDKEEDYDDDDDWVTSDDVADDESISSIEEEKSIKEPTKEVIATSTLKNNLDATSHLERQRQEIFSAAKQQNNPLQNNYQMTYIRHNQHYNNLNNGIASTSTAPSAFMNRMKNFSPEMNPSPKILGPSTSKSSRRSSIDSKAFNEKVFFTTPEEKELLEKLDIMGFDVEGMKKSVLEGKVDSASGLWWLLLIKLREKKKIEGTQSSVTMVDVAVGTSDDEIDIVEETEEEYDSPINSIELDRSQQEEEKVASMKTPEKIIPPTPPPKTYQATPPSRERRKSLILSYPEAVEPVLTTITATASPPLSPKKFSSFTSPISSRSVSPIPSSNPIPISLPNGKSVHRKRGGLLSTIKGWWVGSHNPKDGAYKKSMLNWSDNRMVVPADMVHARRLNRRSVSNEGINLSRRSSNRGGSIRDKKKRRGSVQGIKGGNKRTPAPLVIPPVTPSIVLSQNSPTSMSPIPGTPPAARPKTLFTKNRRNPFAHPNSSWGRKQVKRRSISSINVLLDMDIINAASSSGSSENNNHNNNNNHHHNLTNYNDHQENKDTFEKSAIENINSDDVESKSIKGKSTIIDEQLMIVESSKSKTITLASPPPTPPPPSPNHNVNNNNNNNNNRSITNSSTISTKQDILGLQKVDKRKTSEETLISSDGDEFVDAASTFTSDPRTRSASPSTSTSTSTSPSPNGSPVIKPDVTISNPHSFPSQIPRQQSSSPISITPSRHKSPASPVSPPLSPTEGESPRRKKSHKSLPPFNQVHSDELRKPAVGGKQQSEEKISPTGKSSIPKFPLNLTSTPPESPKLSSRSNPQSKFRQQHTRSYSSPSAALSSNNSNENNMKDNHRMNHINGMRSNGTDIPVNDRRDSSPSPPPNTFNASQLMFLQNNGLNSRHIRTSWKNNGRDSNTSTNINMNNALTTRRPSLTSASKPAMIIEEEEEEENT